jgi:hypothetical protein
METFVQKIRSGGRQSIIPTANLHSEKHTSYGHQTQSSIINFNSRKKKGSHSAVLEGNAWKLLGSKFIPEVGNNFYTKFAFRII